jgi:hypothetical protein
MKLTVLEPLGVQTARLTSDAQGLAIDIVLKGHFLSYDYDMRQDALQIMDDWLKGAGDDLQDSLQRLMRTLNA